MDIVRRGAPLLALAMVACRAPTPAAALADAPRIADGNGGVHLVRYPCSRHGELLAPVDVDGHPTWLLVDTGAYRHVLVPGLVDDARVRRSPRWVMIGRDPGIRATFLAGTTALSMPGVGALPPTSPISFDVPGLAACGTGGVLSPARLATDRSAVIVDLPRARLALSSPAAALQVVDARPGAVFEAKLLTRRAFVAGARIEDEPARLLVDTGACCSWVYRDSPVGRALVSRAEVVTAGPSDIQAAAATHRMRGARLRTGDLSRALDVYFLPGGPAPDEPDGALGIDVLKRCVLAIHGEALRARCEAPRAGTPTFPERR
jgi:hypothetical protein